MPGPYAFWIMPSESSGSQRLQNSLKGTDRRSPTDLLQKTFHAARPICAWGFRIFGGGKCVISLKSSHSSFYDGITAQGRIDSAVWKMDGAKPAIPANTLQHFISEDERSNLHQCQFYQATPRRIERSKTVQYTSVERDWFCRCCGDGYCGEG
ncbi:hypothetical protein DL98DRAFT_604193 [Cadophora sp. DSE1049]|nr:hypothetical protein DL98DRAFT_604193 [Cadophora sp. DSE1049]